MLATDRWAERAGSQRESPALNNPQNTTKCPENASPKEAIRSPTVLHLLLAARPGSSRRGLKSPAALSADKRILSPPHFDRIGRATCHVLSDHGVKIAVVDM